MDTNRGPFRTLWIYDEISPNQRWYGFSYWYERRETLDHKRFLQNMVKSSRVGKSTRL